MGRFRSQRFLAKLIEFELDKNKKIDDISSDTLRYIQRLFHHFLITKTGIPKQRTASKLLEIDFRGICNEEIIPRLGKYLFEDENKPKNKRKIAEWKIKQIYPNIKKYVNEINEEIEVFITK